MFMKTALDLWQFCLLCFCFAGTASTAHPHVLISMLFLCLVGPCNEGAYACPAWRVMSYSTCWIFKQLFSVHKTIRTSLSPSTLRRIGGREGGGTEPKLSDSISPSLSLTPLLPISAPHPHPQVFLIICFLEPCHTVAGLLCVAHFAWCVVVDGEHGSSLRLKASVTSPWCGFPILSDPRWPQSLVPLLCNYFWLY